MKLKDKTVIITGSARGIGKQYALRFSEEGAKVVICDILDCEETAKEIESHGGEVLPIITDITSEESTIAMAEKVIERFGKIDILVNNAAMFGGLVRKPFHEIAVEEWDRLMVVNLRGLFLCCKAVFPFMKEQKRGKIINIASVAAFSGQPFFAHYTASKGGVIAFTRAVARELGEYNINVNAVAPGLTSSQASLDMVPESAFKMSTASKAIKRIQQPEDLVGTIMFLASDESDLITGQTIVVDGGGIFH